MRVDEKLEKRLFFDEILEYVSIENMFLRSIIIMSVFKELLH